MCILCVIQKWSRRVATMLPWLVLPLIGLWLLSQLLPPAFRFEITSPRLACVFVLLVTLFWYEILMPQLSAWTVRRNARLREKKRLEAIELQKLRKTATRKCRNCLTPYRDQNPGGGKFMCSYCGHVSKRPVLDLPVPPGSNSGIFKDLVGKGGRMLNGKVWSDNGWLCGQDWLENGNWVGGGSFGGKSSSWRNPIGGGGGFGGVGDDCLAEKSYNRIFVFTCKLFATVCFSLLWLWRKLFRISSVSRDESSTDVDRGGGLDRRSEDGGTFHESRGEKARRKAEEKRQARLEKELMEEEERKQREEVARLVEERRKLRDEKMEAEKGHHGKRSPSLKGSDRKKETGKKRLEKKKERDIGSSKSNSDVEEMEKRASKESERIKKGDSERRENHRTASGSVTETHGNDVGHAFKATPAHNHSRGSVAGSRYFDRVKGTFLSSSRAFTGGGFFGKSSNTAASRETKSSPIAVHNQIHANKREKATDRISSKPTSAIGDEKNNIRPAGPAEALSTPAPKKSWQHLFTRSSPPSANSNVISRPNTSSKIEDNNPLPGSLPSTPPAFDNPISFGLPLPFTLPSFPPGPLNNSSTSFLPSSEAMFSQTREAPLQFLPEESEIFEDPCVPDPLSLLGPVSESLDNFQLDLGFLSDTGLETPSAVKSTPPAEVSRPSPIESPISRLRILEERHASPFSFPGTSRPQDLQHTPIDGYTNLNEARTYQMWDSNQALGGGPASWLPAELNRPMNEDILHSVPESQKSMASLFKRDDHALSITHSSQKVLFGLAQNGGTPHNSSMAVGNDAWLPKTFLRPNPGGEDRLFSLPKEEAVQNSKTYGSPSGSVTSHLPEVSAANSWGKNDRNVQSSGGVGLGNASVMMKPHIGGLYSTPDVQSLWSYDQEKRM